MALEQFNGVAPVLMQGVWVHPQATIIGACTLHEDVGIWPQAVLRGDVNTIEVGARTNIQDGVVVHVTHESEQSRGAPVIIGAEVTVGHQAVLHGCIIEDACLIGMGAIVLDHAHVETEVMVGAGSLVPPGKVLQSGWLYLGSPVKAVRRLSEQERQFLRYSAQHYVELKDKYAQSGR